MREMRMRIALVVEYDGSQYHGWQAQTGLHTVQQSIEHALSKVADCPYFCCMCRKGQIQAFMLPIKSFIFDCDKERSIRSWIHGANSFLPKDICVKWGKEVIGRVSCSVFCCNCQKISLWLIYNASIRPALLRSNVTWQYRQLDHRLMHQSAQILLGENDFTSFRSVECQSNTPMRNIQQVTGNPPR